MTDIAQRIANLTPAQRAVLQQRLAESAHQSRASQPIPRWEGDRPTPSFGQERLWFLDQIEGSTALYNISVAIRLTGILDTNAVRQAVDAIVRRHETLRTRYTSDGGTLQLDIVEDYLIELPITYLSDPDKVCPAAGDMPRGDAILEQALEAEARRPVALDRDLLLRAVLFRVAEHDHTLQLTMHHIASDGWSLGILYHEFSEFYNAAVTGTEPQLPDLPIRYSDYAHWMRDPIQAAALDKLTSHWVEQLRGSPFALQFPTDHPRPAERTFPGEQRSFALSSDATKALHEFCQREKATPFMVLLASLYAVLHRCSGQSQLLIGSPIAARTKAETEGLIGFFTNTLVLPGDLSDDPTFRTFLQRVRDVALDAYAHQDVPFEKVVQQLNPERDLSRSPLFQVMFVLENAPTHGLDLHGLATSVRTIHTGTAKFDLTIYAEEGTSGDGTSGDGTSGLNALIEYNTDLFEPATIDRLWSQLSTFMQNAFMHPEESVSAIPLLTGAARQAILTDWNATTLDYPRTTPLADLVEAQAGRSPDALAVIYNDTAISYRELNERANQLAHELSKHGAGPESRIGLYIDRSMEMMVALLAIIKSGAAYVPLNPFFAPGRIRYMMEDSDLKIMITQGRLLSSIPSFTGTILDVDSDSWKMNSRANLHVPVADEALAFIIYTSGSTGKPKGVEIPRRALTNLLWSMRQWLQLTAADRVLAVTTISFDIAGADIWLPWLVGATTVVASREAAADGEQLRALIERHDISFLQATPVTWRLLFGAGWQGKPNLQCVCTGEAMAPDLAASLTGSVHRLWNLYGPTETTIWSTGFLVTEPNQPVLIGRPIGNTQCYILDEHREPQPIGVTGELYIAGDGLARGYLNGPDLTREKFVSDPFASTAGARMYRTGDLARYRADGNIECLGRTDNQVKIRGFRIELGEIESVLKQHERIQQAVVIAREGTPGDKRLVAYLVPEGELPPVAELRSYLKQNLPDYMIPAAYVSLDAIPLTPNGKIDRRALAEPDARAKPVVGARVQPRTPTEVMVANVWADVLKTDQIGIDDDFFELGGHSLSATRVMARLRSAVGVDLPIRLLFEHPTIAALAAVVTERTAHEARLPNDGAAKAVIATSSRSAERHTPPLSFAQEQMWLVDQLEPGNTAYIIPCALQLTGKLDVPALQFALTEIVRRHAVLRTAFVIEDAVPVQIVRPALPIRLPLTDLAAIPELSRTDRFLEIEKRETELPFDLTLGSPIRFHLLKLDAEEHRLVVSAHHIAFDGWSLQIFVQELATLYAAFSLGEPSPLPELAWQYTDFAEWQRDQSKGDALAPALDYWRAQLDGAPAVLGLPLDHPRPSARTFRGAGESVCIAPQLARSIAALGRSEGATLFMTMLAAFQLLLSRLGDEDDVVVGIPVAGRTRVETETMLGCFINPLPLRTRLTGSPSFRELLRRVRQTSIECYAHQDVPFDMLVERLHPQRSLSHAPFFQVLFNMLNVPGSNVDVPGMRVERLGSAEKTAKFDLTVYLEERPEGLHLHLVYSTDLFSAKRAAAMLRQYTYLLTQIAAEPAGPISSYSLVPPEEAHVLPDPAALLSASWAGSIPELFAAHVTRTPDRPAVIGARTEWTYRELEERSNRLAHHLRELGAGPGEVVAIYAQRSGSLVWALMSVLKTGAAFVILDCAYPAARLAAYVSAARPRILLRLAEAGVLPAEVGRCVMETAGSAVCDLPAFTQAAAAATAWRDYPVASLDVKIGPDDTAYIAFTSGTTGKPKGIVGRHGSLTHFTSWMASEFGVGPEDRFSLLSGLAHDPLHRDVFTPLQLGSCICVPNPDTIYEPAGLAQWICDSGTTVVHLTPALGQLLSASSPPVELGGLCMAFFVGDALTRRDVARLHAIAPRVRIVNYYGTTETQLAVSYYVAEREALGGEGAERSAEGRARDVVPLGRGTPDVQLLVLTPRGQLAGVGEAGALYIRSPHIAKGYLNDEQLTAERFVANPVTRDLADRCYRTGDLGRYDPDGNVIALGRAAPDYSELRAQLARRSRPQDPVQNELVRLWKELLNVSSVGVTDDFFELGGHSLLAVAMMERVEALFGGKPPLSVLFEEPTVQHLAAVLIGSLGLVESRAVCVQAGAHDRKPLFLFHGDYTGGGLYSRNLVHHFDPGQPTYVLGPHQPGGPETIGEMAADMLPHIRQIQSRGPYLLGGYCNGGLVAVEVARQLVSIGESVGFLAVIDTDARNVELARLYDLVCRTTRLLGFDQRRQIDTFLQIREPALRFLTELPRLDKSSGFGARLVFAGALTALISRRVVRRAWRAALRGVGLRSPEVVTPGLSVDDMTPDERQRRERSAYITRAMLNYIPRPYAGTITVIGAADGRLGDHDDYLRHWRAIGAKVNGFMIPGDHGTIVTSEIEALAAVLRAQMPRPA